MRLLVTRPEPEAVATAAALRALGHEPIVAPLLDIVLSEPPPPVARPAAIAVSSRNGIRALTVWPQAAEWQAVPFFVTGTASAEAAEAAGFADVRAGTGDVSGLIARIAAEVPADAGTILYIAGRDLAGDLAGDLGAKGFAVRTVEAYRAEAKAALDAPIAAALESGGIDGALLYSPRTAAVLVDLARKSGLGGAVAKLRLFALSEAVAEPLRRLPGALIAVAEKPDSASLLALIDEAARPAVTGR